MNARRSGRYLKRRIELFKRHQRQTFELPSNPHLDTAIALSLARHRDPRARQAMMKELRHATLLSLAYPTPRFDPFDVKPQVFALDQFLAIPVFTSVPHLQQFCTQFNFTVRDPSGAVWASPTTMLPPPRAASKPPPSRLFENLVASHAGFDFQRASPLPTYGGPCSTTFVGYFADTQTMLHNLQIIPQKADIVLNPSTPIEIVLSRDLTDVVLRNDVVSPKEYRAVENEIRGEFHRFFARFCPEVLIAWSVTFPQLTPATRVDANDVVEDIVVVIDSEDYATTLSRLHEGKKATLLVGSSHLTVVPRSDVPPHVIASARIFYERPSVKEQTEGEG